MGEEVSIGLLKHPQEAKAVLQLHR